MSSPNLRGHWFVVIETHWRQQEYSPLRIALFSFSHPAIFTLSASGISGGTINGMLREFVPISSSPMTGSCTTLSPFYFLPVPFSGSSRSPFVHTGASSSGVFYARSVVLHKRSACSVCPWKWFCFHWFVVAWFPLILLKYMRNTIERW